VSTDVRAAPDLPPGLADERGAPRDPPRWVAALGLVGALALAVTPFADWVGVDPAEAARHGAALREAARPPAGASAAPDARLEAWSDLGERLGSRHALTGLDLLLWSGAARAQIEKAAADAGGQSAGRARLARVWWVLSAAIVLVAGAGGLLALYLAGHALRRFRAPLQVLAGTAGVLALGLAAGLEWVCRPTTALEPGVAQSAFLVGGAALLGAMVSALTLRSFVTVVGGTVAVLAALVTVAWVWVDAGPLT
jgi:hypothetical protein